MIFKQASPLKINQIFQQIKSKALGRGLAVRAQSEDSTVSCDFGHSKVVFLETKKTDTGIKILRFHKAPRPAAKEKDVELLNQCLKEGGFDVAKVRISIKGQGVIARFIQFPKMTPQELKSALAFEVEKYIPFKSSEVVVDYHILDDNVSVSGGGRAINLLLIAVKRDELYPLIQIFQETGLQIDLIDTDALAAINALEFFHPETNEMATAILDMGAEVSTLSVVQKGKPRLIRDISYGGVDILKRLKRKLGLAEQEALDQLLSPAVKRSAEVIAVWQEALGNLIADLRISLDYYLDQVPGAEPVKGLFLSGGEAFHPFVVSTIGKELNLEVRPMDLMAKIQLGEDVNAEEFKKNLGFLPVVLGLCVREK